MFSFRAYLSNGILNLLFVFRYKASPVFCSGSLTSGDAQAIFTKDIVVDVVDAGCNRKQPAFTLHSAVFRRKMGHGREFYHCDPRAYGIVAIAGENAGVIGREAGAPTCHRAR